MQIKLLRILSIMGAGDRSASENMYAVIDEAMHKANTGHTIGNAIIFECVRTITAIYPNPGLLEAGELQLQLSASVQHCTGNAIL